eukprot:COSAG06_NODE_1922_length_8061_cov_17.839990_6_plen_436_part_00
MIIAQDGGAPTTVDYLDIASWVRTTAGRPARAAGWNFAARASRAEMLAMPLLLLLAVVGPPTAAFAASSFRQTTFVIGGGPDPPPTNTSYGNLRAAGCTFVHADSDEVTTVRGAQEMAALCAANNLSCVLPNVAAKAVAAPSASGSVWGFFVHDEPKAKEFAGLAKSVAEIRSLHPGALSFVNLLGYGNFTTTENRALYGTDTYEEYVDGFLATVKPDILSYDCYPNETPVEMDLMHLNLQIHRNKSLAAGIPMWNYIWLAANGRGHGVGFYRWQLWVSAAYGSRGIMQWSLSPCANIHACGPKDRWAPYPCLLDKHGGAFKPVFNMASTEHARILALGPRLLALQSQRVVRLAPSHATPVVKVTGMPLKSISSGKWVLGHLRPESSTHSAGGVAAGTELGSSMDNCVMIVNDVSPQDRATQCHTCTGSEHIDMH